MIMKTQIDAEALKTKEFMRYFFSELMERFPLREREIIEINMVEGSTPFPKVIETSESYPDGKFISKELDYVSDRAVSKMIAIDEYLQEALQGGGAIVAHGFYPYVPLTSTLPVVVVHPTKLYEIAREHGLEIPQSKNTDTTANSVVAEFAEHPPEIHWLGANVPIPPNSIQFCVCRVAFRKASGETVSWDEVADEIDGGKETHSKTTWRGVYDATRRINKKVASATGKPLFRISKRSFYRVA